MTAIQRDHLFSLISQYRNENLNGPDHPKENDGSVTVFSELKEIYDSQYEDMHKRIDNMGDPKTITVNDKNGESKVATEITAEQYQSLIPTFEKWIAMQETFQDMKFQTMHNPPRAEGVFDTDSIEANKTDVDVEVKEQKSSSVEAFAEFMEKTPEEVLFEAFLKRHDLTEEEFEDLTFEEKESLMKEFEEELKARARSV